MKSWTRFLICTFGKRLLSVCRFASPPCNHMYSRGQWQLPKESEVLSTKIVTKHFAESLYSSFLCTQIFPFQTTFRTRKNNKKLLFILQCDIGITLDWIRKVFKPSIGSVSEETDLYKLFLFLWYIVDMIDTSVCTATTLWTSCPNSQSLRGLHLISSDYFLSSPQNLAWYVSKSYGHTPHVWSCLHLSVKSHCVAEQNSRWSLGKRKITSLFFSLFGFFVVVLQNLIHRTTSTKLMLLI